ncbi:MAG: outer membrane beta-barrel protein [Gammaproteobacteria bacterium]
MTFMAHRIANSPGIANAIVLLLMPLCAHAQLDVTIYSGVSDSRNSDVQLTQPVNTSLTFHNVSWDDQSLDNPVYWGARLTYWFPHARRWGMAVDFTHAKIHADLRATVNVTGTRAGSTVNDQEVLGNTFSVLAMSHGFNLLTINAMYRWMSQPRLQPFIGFGAGLAYPHVEVKINSSHTDEYQLAGWAINGMTGLNYDLGKGFALFAEYKISYADMKADLNGGGTLKTKVWTNHLNLGVTYHFGQ